jgi:hypothetical protein
MGSLMATEYWDCHKILSLESCRHATSVELMPHRWSLAAGHGDRPAALVAHRFARVEPLRLPHPLPGATLRVWLHQWLDDQWFTHARVRHGAGGPVVTLANTLTRLKPWRSFALTLPADAPWLEIDKCEEMSCWLIALEFEPVAAAALATSPPTSPLRGVGILDGMTFLGSTMLPSYGEPLTGDFYRQMHDAGFTDAYLQVYYGSAGWSRTARRAKTMPFGHLSFANHREPGYRAFDTVEGLGRQLALIKQAGLRAGASFRINNEWITSWALKWYRVSDGVPEIASAMSVEHPEWWMTYKDGTRFGSGLDFAFPQVADYRLAILEEWCELFADVDAICIDLCRHPPMVSYPEHLVSAFREKTGVDVRQVQPVEQDTPLESWLRFRAAPFTQWMRRVRDLLRRRLGPRVTLSARVANSADRALVDGAELDIWMTERLVDELLLESGTERHPLDEDVAELASAARRAGIRTTPVFGKAAGLAGQPEGAQIMADQIERWRGQGVDGVGFYEAERLAALGQWIELLPRCLGVR